MKKPLILLTNDDGLYAEGISVLSDELTNLGQIYIVAPDQEKSASSLALTLHHPLRVKQIKKNRYAVNGTPADCVYLAVQKFLPRLPDLLISGINHGPNLGQQDTSYSGTVAGAKQGAFLDIPSMAVSLIPDNEGQFSFAAAAKIVHALATNILENPLPQGIFLNINIPAPPLKGIKIAQLGQKRYNPRVIEKEDPRGRLYYWIGTGNPKALGDSDSDVMVIKEGYITVTPLQNDSTDLSSVQSSKFHKMLESFEAEIL
ncbi:MAG: 5'/3'-nucleotidase SurE [Candidatus Aminicenantes bacterium]|nr:MAG: 5'/3'-nucleotidase SurE [Candidatus Aminicenantes bacterium]